MNFEVKISNRAKKALQKLPEMERQRFYFLVLDLEENGAVQPKWKNFSKIGANKYHCHLSYKWVACWTNENNTIVIEVYYVGSRENAPY